MKTILFTFLISVFHSSLAARENYPDAAELLKISETDNFSQLVKLGKQLRYELVDSSII